MHLDKFDLNLLVALDALLTEKHVTRAAEKLCVSQPAMSAALSRLRAYFDDQLLTKVGAGLELTPRAQELSGEVRDVIFRIRSTLRTEPTFDPSTGEREFRLLMSDYSASVFMPALTRSLLTDAPGVRCMIEHLAPDSLTRIDHGVAEFCITVEQRELLEETLIAETLSGAPLFEDDFVVVVDAASAAAEEPLTLDGLLARPYVEVRFSYAVFSVVETAIRQQRLALRPKLVMPGFTEAAGLISGTGMATIIPRQLARRIGPTFGLTTMEAPFPLPRLRETLIWHKRNDADPAHRWFRDYLLRVATGLNFSEGPAADRPRFASHGSAALA
ncbi:LysR family transcriptional regulator [Sphingomonas sp. CGMCC 1.13654]|uniref:LysR family transcriptional regulator n=1 Tax=Sphingomonas chungangi TaxID=2683589 RepID=A0A838L2T2_9SPHN|nr:LysR family transcriptional regulator [Sphingomonas chungangi]MBA2933494.1 LysR family transcriptional regulator [Sphingomonas chungangi]MVW54827.1 LysR family transcriptional regulator [Sphingomonas chungangi]